jgi:hypothetical protein
MTLRPIPFDRSFRGSYSRYRDKVAEIGCLTDQLRELEYIVQDNTYLTDQLRELECQSVQATLLILLQGYDIISRERTDDVMYDIIKY